MNSPRQNWFFKGCIIEAAFLVAAAAAALQTAQTPSARSSWARTSSAKASSKTAGSAHAVFESRVDHTSLYAVEQMLGLRVTACIAEHFDHEIGRAIHHGGQGGVIGLRIDEAAEAHDARDLVEIAERDLGLRQQIDRPGARRR